MLALHEAEVFFENPIGNLHIMSVGTMSSRFTANPRRNRSGGTYDWGGLNPANMPKRLFGLSISVQESLSDFALRHRLGSRYVSLDDVLTDERAQAVALDRADAAAKEVLLGAASEQSKSCLGRSDCQRMLQHRSATPKFYYGPNAN